MSSKYLLLIDEIKLNMFSSLSFSFFYRLSPFEDLPKNQISFHLRCRQEMQEILVFVLKMLID